MRNGRWTMAQLTGTEPTTVMPRRGSSVLKSRGYETLSDYIRRAGFDPHCIRTRTNVEINPEGSGHRNGWDDIGRSRPRNRASEESDGERSGGAGPDPQGESRNRGRRLHEHRQLLDDSRNPIPVRTASDRCLQNASGPGRDCHHTWHRLPRRDLLPS